MGAGEQAMKGSPPTLVALLCLLLVGCATTEPIGVTQATEEATAEYLRLKKLIERMDTDDGVILALTARGIDEEMAQAVVGAGIAFLIAIYNVSQGGVDKAAASNGG